MTLEHSGATRIAGPEACSRILLVGESNPYGADPRYALYNEPATSAGGRLQRLIFCVSGRRWYLPMWRTNLCAGAWDVDAATERASALLGLERSSGLVGRSTTPTPWEAIVMFGVSVNTAFRRAAARCADVSEWPGPFAISHQPIPIASANQVVVALPHPSGRNAASWGADAIVKTRDLMRSIAPEIPWGDRDA